MGGHGYSSPLVCLFVCLFLCDMGYSSPLVCLFVCFCVTCESTHLDAIFTAWIASTQQVLIVADFDVKASLSYFIINVCIVYLP